MVQIIGVPSKVGGIRRYGLDLEGILEARGVGLDEIVHAVQPILLPRGKHFVVTCHDLAPINTANSGQVNYDSTKARLYRRYFRLTVKRSFESAAAIVADSSQTLNEIKELFNCGDKAVVVSPGIAEKFKPLKIRKGKSTHVGFPRDCVSDAELLGRLLGDAKMFPLEGYPEESLVQYYNGLDYFIDLGTYRGFGYPILEARACGVTVLTLRRARIPEEVKRFTIQVDNFQEAAGIISKGESQSFEEIPFTLDRMADGVLSVYKKVIDI